MKNTRDPYILLIDNETSHRSQLEQELRDAGYWIWSTGSVESARKLIPEIPELDIVLLDRLTQAEEEQQLLQEIEKAHPCVAVILMLAQKNMQDFLTGSNRIFSYISKPVQMTELTRMMQRAVQTRQEKLEHQKEDCIEVQEYVAAGLKREIEKPFAEISDLLNATEGEVTEEPFERLKAGLTHIESTLTKLKDLVQPSQAQTVSLQETLKEAANGLPPGIQVDWFLPKSDCQIQGGQELQKAFVQLLKNAAEAMQFKGRIMIDVKLSLPRVEVRISDQGCGMSSEVQRQAFTPFYTTKGQSGLGLTVAQEIVDSLGGTLAIEKSEAEEGTTLLVVLS